MLIPYIPPPVPGQNTQEEELCEHCDRALEAYKKARDASYNVYLQEIEESTKKLTAERIKHEERKILAWAVYEAVIAKHHSGIHTNGME